MAETKKKNLAMVSTKNDLICQIPDAEYIKNPLVYSQIRGDFSLIQTNILVAIATVMQDRINSHFDEHGKLMPLFSKEELSHGKITFEVPLMSLGVKTKEYATVHESCKALTKLDTTYTYKDEEGKQRTRTSVIFTDVDVPTFITQSGNERRQGTIKIDMNANVAEQIFNNSSAYVEHMEGIVKMCRSPRTPRLYIYLSAWKEQKVCTFGYEALKEFLGVLVYSKDRTKIVSDKCSTWAVFHRDVLDPAKKEMKKLADQGKIEFYFEYEPVYMNGKSRGIPKNVRFFLMPATPIAQVEEIKDTKPRHNLSNEQYEKWLTFSKLVRERVGESFFNTYFKYCGVKSITDKGMTIIAPTQFVCEQWNENMPAIFPCVMEVFHFRTINYFVDPNYDPRALFDF